MRVLTYEEYNIGKISLYSVERYFDFQIDLKKVIPLKVICSCLFIKVKTNKYDTNHNEKNIFLFFFFKVTTQIEQNIQLTKPDLN